MPSGKTTKRSISMKSTWNASQILELVHTDIGRLINPISNNNKKYMLIFIDNSCKHWVFLLVENLEGFCFFIKKESICERDWFGH